MNGFYNMLKFSTEQIDTAVGANIPNLENIEGQQRQLADALEVIQLNEAVPDNGNADKSSSQIGGDNV